MPAGAHLLVHSGPGFRRDLEGIRGIGLVVILLVHLIGRPPGGFVFLDMFFVLSGYLITGLLLREYRKNGRISLLGFYRRRIRRLMPIATIVIVFTVVGSFLLFANARAMSVLWDGVSALFLVSNWRFAFAGVDYFATWMPQSPLLHYWSLSVEEQFYLFWPAMIIITLAITTRARSMHMNGARRGGVSFTPLVIVIAVVSVASLAWAIIQPMSSPEISYLSTLTRVWQLGVGALLAFGNHFWAKIPNWLRPVLSWGGLSILIATAVLFSSALPYPSYWALMPVAASVMIIVAGVGAESYLVIATNPVVRFLGQISYSAYLWHWPLFIFVSAIVGEDSPWYLWGAIPLALLMATVSFYLIENPIRTSKWLEPRRRRSWERHRRNRKIAQVGALSSLVVAAVVGVVVFSNWRPTFDDTPPPPATPSVRPTDKADDDPLTAGTAVEAIETELGKASSASEWPQAVLDQINAEAILWGGEDGDVCLDVVDENEEFCTIGDDSLEKTAVLLGDSVAVAWRPGLAEALNSMGYRLHPLNHGQCPFSSVSVSGSVQEGGPGRDGFPEDCDDHRAWTFERVQEIQPDLIIVADAELQMAGLILDEDDDSREEWTQGLVASYAAVSPYTDGIVVLSSAPRSPSVLTCYTSIVTPDACMGSVNEMWFDQYLSTVEAEERIASDNFNVVDVRPLFCASDRLCPAFAGDVLIRADEQHITSEYSFHLADALRELIQPFTSQRGS